MQITSFHVGVAAEAFAAGLFARCELDVSVQYGANQPEYDLGKLCASDRNDGTDVDHAQSCG